ncbi:alpha/beta hydrolase [Streptococcus sp. DD13]|uniref:alpha/beta hydrolase n=1 Tax=Streptococcus sp. DD13 TaxID=1777881 RepID=UPI00079B5E50|nr:alpha/beta hydrolase [Streptococcus sp. DD13]KXT78558.1 carboxymethylenebutenolidase-related protein [Streptococcus sp. DD13]
MEEYHSANVTEDNHYIFFDGKEDKGTILFQGGALVEVQAYSFLAEELSQKGYDVYLLKALFNLPILNQNAAQSLIQEKNLTRVFLAGHSLGGTMSATAAKTNPAVQGLILLASYPSDDTDLSQEKIRVLSITASEDKVLRQSKYKEAKNRLPKSTSYQIIEGGNHAGFGLYGPQKGDGKALITLMEQQDRTYHLILDFLESQSVPLS